MALETSPVKMGNLPEPAVFSRPAPFPGCEACSQYDQQWVNATTPGHPDHDPSKSVDIVVLMSRHKAATHGGVQ